MMGRRIHTEIVPKSLLKAVMSGVSAVLLSLLLSLIFVQNLYGRSVKIQYSGLYREVSGIYGGDEDEIIDAALFLKGTHDVSGLSEETLEEFEKYASRPLEINLTSESGILSCILFSQYQKAVLLDYRKRNGDILSLTELSLLDGFSKEIVSALAHFISLSPSNTIGSNNMFRPKPEGKVSVRNENKFTMPQSTDESIGISGAYGVMSDFSIPGSVDVHLSASGDYGGRFPVSNSLSITLYGKKKLKRVILGDFHTKFGQGMALWSGFSMKTIDSPSALMKNPRGICSYGGWSGNGTNFGAAAEFMVARTRLSAFICAEGMHGLMRGEKTDLKPMAGINSTWLWRRGEASLTAYSVVSPSAEREKRVRDAVLSADGRYSLGKAEISGEAVFDIVNMSVAGLAGSRFKIMEGWKGGIMGKYSAKEHCLAAAAEHGSGKWCPLKGKTGFGASVRRFTGSAGLTVAFMPDKINVKGDYNTAGKLNEQTQSSQQVSGKLNGQTQLKEQVAGKLNEQTQLKQQVPRKLNGQTQSKQQVSGKLNAQTQLKQQVSGKLNGQTQSSQQVPRKLNGQTQLKQQVLGKLNEQTQSSQQIPRKLNEQTQSSQQVSGKLNGQTQSSQQVSGKLNGQTQSKEQVSGKLQMKLQISEKIQLSPSLCLAIRISESIRLSDWRGGDGPPSGNEMKTSLRSDLTFDNNCFWGRFRAEANHCRSVGRLVHLEGGLKKEWGRVYLAAGAFHADNWEDRIYLYERNPPGGFSVPALYKRGYTLSLYTDLKLPLGLRFHLKAGWKDYVPGVTDKIKKSGRAELKFMLSFSF